MGYEVTMGEVWRTPEQAKLNAENGTGINNSLHSIRLAVDLNLFMDGKFLQRTEEYTDLGLFWESLSTTEYECSWGGRFTKGDGNHFSISHNGCR